MALRPGGARTGSGAPAALAFVAASLALMATYLLWLYVRPDGWPQRPPALAFAALAYLVSAAAVYGLARLPAGPARRGEPDADRQVPPDAACGAAAGAAAASEAAAGAAAAGGAAMGVRLEPDLAAGPGAEGGRAAVRELGVRAVERPLAAASLLVSVFLAVTVGFALWARGDGGERYWDLSALWLLAIALYAAPFLGSLPRPARPWRAVLRRPGSAVWDAVALAGAALVVRVPLVGRWPDILGGDEGLAGGVARAMVERVGNPFSTLFAYGNLYHLLLAAFVAVLGPTAAALRLPNAVAGSLAVGVTALAGNELFGRRVGLAAGAFLAVAHMHVHMSRTAHGQAIDTLIAAVVILALARGIRRRRLWWMAVAGIGLGLAQYFYVGGRVLDLIAVVFVLLLLVLDRRAARRALSGLAVALGAAFVTAVPMLVWALRRPDDYLTRLNATGFVQTGGLADRVAEGGAGWAVMVGQLARAVTVPLAYPAVAFYNASIPMLDLAMGALAVLGLFWALAHARDWRYMLLLAGTGCGILVLALGNLITIAAYRITVVMPFLVLLAAAALVALVTRGLTSLRAPPHLKDAALLVTVAGIAGYNLGYTFLVHLPQCRYLGDDPATAAVSMTSLHLARSSPRALVVALTEPAFKFGAYPNGRYYLGRDTRPIAEALADGAPEAVRETHVLAVPPGYDAAELVALVRRAGRPAAFVVATARLAELDELVAALPGGERTAFYRCGETHLADVYLLP